MFYFFCLYCFTEKNGAATHAAPFIKPSRVTGGQFCVITENQLKQGGNAEPSLVIYIPCTACHYCVDGCPQRIPIPNIFAARNRQTVWNQISGGKWNYDNAVKDKGKASDCIACG
ncbi:MAG: 4Fe-4S dicluster domain-containing protein, partial [Firmicutes bacterium]|nr:4Fe-4S dicluster domain-containing protein [Bacillota bacterium]